MRGIVLFVLTALPCLFTPIRAAEPRLQEGFDVVIAGGTTAAFAAALASAESGARTALIEPTDWVGGQLTASGVPAIDEAWHKITDRQTGEIVLDVSKAARDRANMTPNFRAMLDATGNPGGGWVSNYCFLPKDFLKNHLIPAEKAQGSNLVVFRETVIKSVEVDRGAGLIRSIVAIRRHPQPPVQHQGYDALPSKDLPDWYSPLDSNRFTKETLVFPINEAGGRRTVFMDATEWGEVLALSEAPYLIGFESKDGGLEGDETCGQATVFGFAERLDRVVTVEPTSKVELSKVEGLGFGGYKSKPDAWDQIWRYRRLQGKGSKAEIGDITLQNWGYSGRDQEGGNDYPFGYLFKSKAATAAERSDWLGGLNLTVMAAAEARAFAWHDWFRNHAPAEFQPGQIILDGSVFGTGHGLCKLPYIRDTRRSVGLDNFVLKFADISGDPAHKTGKRFTDRIALGAYPADIHPVLGCKFPAYLTAGHDTLPFCIPFRALTNASYKNLLVAGKTMAQGFLTNAGTRLHPIEWSTGTAAGVAAADMAIHSRSSREELAKISDLQSLIKKKSPINWTIDGVTYTDSDGL